MTTPKLIINFLHLSLSEHPSVVNFRWSPTDSWGATWSFLIASISAYVASAFALHAILLFFRRKNPVPLGPIPALHSLSMSLVSAATFAGILLSSSAEIRDTRWLWHRSKTTPFQWLLCFPLGTRHSGRVFFWSYVFYLSRFLHVLRTFLAILKNPGIFPGFRVLNHSVLICMAYLWLEFSQSLQVLAILSTTLVLALVYGYRFSTETGLRKRGCFPFVMFCQILLAATNIVWHLGVLVLHFWKGGCNGMGAWGFNAVLNGFVLVFVLNFYVKKCLKHERDCDDSKEK